MKKIIVLSSFLTAVILLASCADYGKKAQSGHIETYYKDGITEAQAQKTADLLYRIDVGANNETNQKSFQLCKEKDTVCFRMVVNKTKQVDVNDFNYLIVGNLVSDSIFNGAPVNLDLTDNKFKTIRTLHYKKLTEAEIDQAK